MMHNYMIVLERIVHDYEDVYSYIKFNSFELDYLATKTEVS